MSLSDPRVKRVLTLLMVAGALALAGGGTFASFSAQTTNPGSSLASGTLTLSDTVGEGTACLSMEAKSANNFNASCAKALSLSNVAPGVFGGVAKITVKNSGSLDASKLYLWAPQVNANLKTALTENTAVTSLGIEPLEGSVAVKDEIVLSYGTHSQTFEASAAASGGATSISVTSKNANFSYPAGASISDKSANTNASNTDCYDSKTTEAGTSGATKGTELNFNSTSENPLCKTALIFVQETTGGNNYCWLGHGAESASGMCLAPISVKPSSELATNKAITSLPVAALNGNVTSGDTLEIVSGSQKQTFKASANAYIGATSLSIESATPNFAYPTTSTITDTTTLGTLNSDTTATISNFDTAHNGEVGKVQLYPLISNGKAETTPSVELGHSGSATAERTFYVGVYLPAPASGNQNALQGLQSTFGLTWHIDQ